MNIKMVQKSVACVILFSFSAVAETFNFESVEKKGHVGDHHREIKLSGNISISENTELPYEFNISARKNGTLKCGGLCLHVFDKYYDGTTYLLDVDFHDLDNDGIKELIVYGSVRYSTGKELSDPPDEIENVFFIYKFDSDQKKFREKHKRASFNLESVGDANTQWWNRVMGDEKGAPVLW